MAKKDRNNIPKSGKIIEGFAGLGFDLMRHWLHDLKFSKGPGKNDNIERHFSDLEHMLIRLEDRLNENRRIIEDLKAKIYLYGLIIIGLLITVAVQIFTH